MKTALFKYTMKKVDISTYIFILPKRRVFLAAVFCMWVHCDSLKATKCQNQYYVDVFDEWRIFFISAEWNIKFTIWRPRFELSPAVSVNVQAVQFNREDQNKIIVQGLSK